jgi:hypothetical protein
MVGPMPRYSFFYVDASGSVRDQENIELASDGDARNKALATARNLLNTVTSSLAVNWRGWTIVVKSESNRDVCAYPIRKANSLS